MRAPAESTRYTMGVFRFRASSMIRMIFSTVCGPHDPHDPLDPAVQRPGRDADLASDRVVLQPGREQAHDRLVLLRERATRRLDAVAARAQRCSACPQLLEERQEDLEQRRGPEGQA